MIKPYKHVAIEFAVDSMDTDQIQAHMDRVVGKVGGTLLSISITEMSRGGPLTEEMHTRLDEPVSAVTHALTVSSRPTVNHSLKRHGIKSTRDLLAYGKKKTLELPKIQRPTLAKLEKKLREICPVMPWPEEASITQIVTLYRDVKKVPLFVVDTIAAGKPGTTIGDFIKDPSALISHGYGESAIATLEAKVRQYMKEFRRTK